MLDSGEIIFDPGETLKNIVINSPPTNQIVRLRLNNPVGCELTGINEVWYIPQQTTNQQTIILIRSNHCLEYLDDGSNQGTVWRELLFNDSGWRSEVAELGFGDGDETTTLK